MAMIANPTARINRKRASVNTAPDTRLAAALDRLHATLAGPRASKPSPAPAPTLAAPAITWDAPRIVVTPDARMTPAPINPQFFAGHDSDRDAPIAYRIGYADLVRSATTIEPGPVDPDPIVNRADDDLYIDSRPSARPFDPTVDDGDIHVTRRRDGKLRTFRVGPPADGWTKKRVVSLLTGDDPDDDRAWTGFAMADEFGLKVWWKKSGTRRGMEPNGFDHFAEILASPSEYSDFDFAYRRNLD